MQPITTYDTANRFLRLLLQGPPKSGKTVLACQFPRPYVIDLDVNLGGPLRFMRERNLPLPVGYDVLDKDENGKDVPVSERYIRLDKLIKEAAVNPNIDTVIFDSATNLVDVFIAEVLRQQKKPVMSKQEWGFFFALSKNWFGTVAQMRKHIVIPAHEKINKDKEGAVILPYDVAWPGQFGQIIGAFMTDIWRTDCQEGAPVNVGGKLQKSYSWLVKTMPSYQYKLGNSLGLPPEFEFKWETIAAKLTGGTK